MKINLWGRRRRRSGLIAVIVTSLLLLAPCFVECSPAPELSLHNLLSDGGQALMINPELDSESFAQHSFTKRNAWAIEEVQECRRPKKKTKRLKECKEDGKFPVQNECRVFLSCEKGKVKPTPICCPEGLHFDHRLRTCTQTKEARCNNVCEKPGTKYPDPNNLQRYLQCGDLGIPESLACNEGCHYDADKQECVCGQTRESANEYAEDHGLDQAAVNDILDGYEFPDQEPKNQTEQEGRGMGGKKKGKKGIAAKSVCRSPTPAEKDKMTSCPKEGQFPVKDECKLFRKCYNSGKEPVFTCCPNGFRFHHILRRCVAEDHAKCVDVCTIEGTKFPHPTNTRWYQMCTKNGELEEYKCKKKHRYDDTTKNCIKFSQGPDDKNSDTGTFIGEGSIKGKGNFVGSGTFKGNGTFYENGTFVGTGTFKGKGNFVGTGVFGGKWTKVEGRGQWSGMKQSEEDFLDDVMDSDDAGYTKMEDDKDEGDTKVKPVNGEGKGMTMKRVDNEEGKQSGRSMGEQGEEESEEEWEDEDGNRYTLYRAENEKQGGRSMKEGDKDDVWEDENGRKFEKKKVKGKGKKDKKKGSNKG